MLGCLWFVSSLLSERGQLPPAASPSSGCGGSSTPYCFGKLRSSLDLLSNSTLLCNYLLWLLPIHNKRAYFKSYFFSLTGLASLCHSTFIDEIAKLLVIQHIISAVAVGGTVFELTCKTKIHVFKMYILILSFYTSAMVP